MIGILVTDSISCRIYQYQRAHSHLLFLKEINHPEHRLFTRELISDKPGHYQSSHSTRGTYAQAMDPKEVMIDAFAREIAQELDAGRKKNLYDEFIIITPPAMEGLLTQHMNKHVRDRVIKTIHKDWMHLSEKELLEKVKEEAKYPG